MSEVWCGKDSSWKKKEIDHQFFASYWDCWLVFQFQQHFTDSFLPVAEIVLWKIWFAQDKIGSSSHLEKSFQKVPRSDLCIFYISFLHVAWRKCSEVGLNWGMRCLRAHWRSQQRCRGRGIHMTASRGPLENVFFFFIPCYTTFTETNKTR